MQKWQQMFGEAIKTHFFATAGSVLSTVPTGAAAITRALKSNLAASCGMGVAVAAAAFTIELNVCYPLQYGAQDQPVKGMQFGAGINFL